MFLVYDTGIRLVLLEHFQHYAAFIGNLKLMFIPLSLCLSLARVLSTIKKNASLRFRWLTDLDKTTLEDDILPALLLGLKDTNPKIVSQTLR